MQKQVFTTFLVLMIVSLSSYASLFGITGKVIEGSCTDSDGGKDYFVVGKATGLNADRTDTVTTADQCVAEASGSRLSYVSSCTPCSVSNIAGCVDRCAVDEAICTNFADPGGSLDQAGYYSPAGAGVTCEFGCNNGACLKSASATQPSQVKELVKCQFTNANTEQKCYTDDMKYTCKGIETCTVEVSGEKGTKLTWKSSCGGNAYTVIDGTNDYANFDCSSTTPTTQPTEPVIDLVKCQFTNANTEQKCYTDDGKFSCSGIDTCTTRVSGDKGIKLTWKSSCGGNAYTVIDGTNDYANFDCSSTAVPQKPECSSPELVWFTQNNPVTKNINGVEHIIEVLDTTQNMDACQVKVDDTTAIIDIGTSNPINGVEIGVKEISSKNCRLHLVLCPENKAVTTQPTCPSDTDLITQIEKCKANTQDFETYADENSCKQVRCFKKGCAPDSELLTQIEACKTKGLDYSTGADENACKAVKCVEKETQQEVKPEVPMCNGCLLDNKCLPIGTRANKQYCDIDNKIKDIKEDNAECSNSFECTSNLCVNNACVAGNVWQKFLAFLANLFGG